MPALASASGCERTALVGESSPMRVGPRVKGRVYLFLDGEWRVGAPIDYPEGWYLVPPSFVEDED